MAQNFNDVNQGFYWKHLWIKI